MITRYPAALRGKGNFGWLQTNYSFSFANYFHPQRMGFGALRVLNDDIIAAGYGFDMHPHENMEIVTIVLEGELEHQDSMGHGGKLRPGDVQHMSAGSGIVHAERNSGTDDLKLLQIWVEPKHIGITPSYAQKHFDFPKNELVVVASSDPAESDALQYNQDGQFVVGVIDEQVTFTPQEKSNGIFVFVIDGEVDVNGTPLKARDEAQCLHQSSLTLTPKKQSRVLIIEVPVG